MKRGLELSAFGVVDVNDQTALHLDSELTLNKQGLADKELSQMDFYVGACKRRLALIQKFGNTLVVDTHFGVASFVTPLTALNITIVSALRSNAVLYYLPTPPAGGRKPGRPPVKGQRINWNNVDDRQLPIVEQNNEKTLRSGVVYVQSLKRKVLLCRVTFHKINDKSTTKNIFCSDISKDWDWVVSRYRLRFQIEFLFRDGKQHLGLTNFQTTDAQKIRNHLNMSLTILNTMKVTHWLSLPKEERGAFSVATIKKHYQNNRIIVAFNEMLVQNVTELKLNVESINRLNSMVYEKLCA